MKKLYNFLHFPSRKCRRMFLVTNLKLTILLLCTANLSANHLFSQQIRFDVTFENRTIISVLDELKTQTGYRFAYNKGTFNESETVTVDIKDATLDQILEKVLHDRGYQYEIEGRIVFISASREKAVVRQQPQPVRVTGTVTGPDKKPVAGASVMVKGTTRGTITDAAGHFDITVPAGSATLQISCLGMVTQEVDITGKTTVTVALVEAENVIENVVVTGIFTKPRESSVGAAPTYYKDELRAASNHGVLSAIANIDPSFNMIQDMEYGSDPNRLPDITMRGRTSMDHSVRDLQEESSVQSKANLPLFILDGFEISLQRVIDMDQEMVESITLLKDASATALYGARGANGIVVITSRRPEPGRLRVNYRGNLNIEAPDFTSYNLMNSREKLEYEFAAGRYNSTTDDGLQTLRELYNQRLIEVERGVDTYWLKYPVRTGIGHRHSLTLDGGADNFRYSAGVSYNNVAGVMKKSSRNTFSGNLFFQYDLKNIKFQNDLTIVYNKNRNSPYGNFSEYSTANPIYTPYDDGGNLKKMLSEGNTPPRAGNPLYNATLPYRDDGKYINIQNNFAIEWHINPDFFMRARAGITKQDGRSDKYLSREHTSFETDEYSGDNYRLRGSYIYGTEYVFSYEGDITLNYNKIFAGRHQLYAGFNFSIGENNNETYSITAAGFSALNMANLGMAGAYPPDGKPSSMESRSRRVGATLNVNYTFDQCYFVDVSGKIEGSSKFGANNRTAPFWSAGIGWNIHNESFMKDVNAIDNLRVRLSYGTTGSQNFNSYQALTTYRYFTAEGYKYWNGSYIIALGNPDLTWQKTKQANLGFETTLFNRRVNIIVDYYDKLTESLLSDIDLPTSGGFESYKANVGEVSNRGIEATINVFILRNADGFTWSVGGNMVHNKNKILKISNALEFLNNELMESAGPNPSFLYREGESMNTIYVVKSLGIDPATGNEVFLDRNGKRTDTWDAHDKVACGVDEPKIRGNIRTMLRWKNLAFNATFSYDLGGDIYNQTLVNKVENISTAQSWNNLDRRALYDRWQNPGDNVYFKRITDFNATNASSRFVMRENSLRLNSLNLSYEFDTKWLKKHVGVMEYLMVSLYAENVFYISTIKRERGTAYPFARQFSLSVSTRF